MIRPWQIHWTVNEKIKHVIAQSAESILQNILLESTHWQSWKWNKKNNDLVDRIVNSLNMLQFSGHVPKNTRMYTLSLYYIWYVTSESPHVLLSVVVEYWQLFQTDLFHIVSGGCPIQQSFKNKLKKISFWIFIGLSNSIFIHFYIYEIGDFIESFAFFVVFFLFSGLLLRIKISFGKNFISWIERRDLIICICN